MVYLNSTNSEFVIFQEKKIKKIQLNNEFCGNFKNMLVMTTYFLSRLLKNFW